MADLFDINVGGTGFHVTSHFIALAALFIASFAIAGYITFKNNSIDRKKLRSTAVVRDGKDGDSWVYRQTLSLDDLTDVSPAVGTEVAAVVPLQLQKDSVIHGVKIIVVDAGTVGGQITLTTHNKELIVGSVVPGTATALSGGVDLSTDAASANSAGNQLLSSRVNYFYLSSAADISATTNTPQVHVQINWIGPAPIGY